MKKLIYVLAIALVFVSCKEEQPKDYVTLSGKIENKASDSVLVAQNKMMKWIIVDEDGRFSDTLKVEAGRHAIGFGHMFMPVYLINGFDLQVTVNMEQFSETLTYSGIGEVENNYLAKTDLLKENVINASLYDLDKDESAKKITQLTKNKKELLENTQTQDSAFIAEQYASIENNEKWLFERYEAVNYTKRVLAKGNASPKFIDYINYKGGNTSLDDLKGKFIYIDIWATWCVPCKKEIPFLEKVAEKYHGKNIEFVSISIDDETRKGTVGNALKAWKTMVADKELGGIQLLADKGWKSEFIKAYRIKSIPRFILIDPDGNIISNNAPRPSNEKLIALFDELEI